VGVGAAANGEKIEKQSKKASNQIMRFE